MSLHGAHFVEIGGAGRFFTSLLEQVEALEEFDRPHPVSTQAAVVTLKRYLSEDKYRIPLRELLVSEAEHVQSAIDAAFAHVAGVSPDEKSTQELMKRLEGGCEKLIHLFANGSFYATREQAKAFFDAFHLVVVKAQSSGGFKVWINLRRYPALLLAYAAGIAAIASENYAVLSEIASRPSFIKHDYHENAPAPIRIYAHSAMERDVAREFIPGMERRHTPVSDYLFNVLRDPLSRLAPDETLYERSFDDFEYLWCLLCVDAQKQRGSARIWPPYGAFCWRRGDGHGEWFKDQAKNAAEQSDKLWPPLKGGLFGGSIERLSEAFNEAQPHLDELSNKFM